MDRVVDFFFEVGMLKRTPRSGWQFLGSGHESVAEHSYRVAMIAWTLARLDGTVDSDRVIRMALMHDLPEARTGDLNYVNQRYATADEGRSIRDQAAGLPIGDELEGLHHEMTARSSAEARLVHDADQLEMLLSLKEQADAGNPAAVEWTSFVVNRLCSSTAVDLAKHILDRHSSAWWFDQGSDWWVRGGKR